MRLFFLFRFVVLILGDFGRPGCGVVASARVSPRLMENPAEIWCGPFPHVHHVPSL